MTGRGIDQILPRSVDPRLYERYVKDAGTYVRIAEQAGAGIPEAVGFDYVWGEALDELDALGPDHRVVNLETAVTTHGEPWPDKGIHYRMHPANVPVLAAAGLDAVVLGNNHVLDWGRPGLRETVGSVRDGGIATAGAGMDEEEAAAPAVLEGPTGRTLLFSWASPTAGVPAAWSAGPGRAGVAYLEELGAASAERVAGEVGRWRQEGDRVVVSIHWGGNWGYGIPAEQRVFARHLVELGGADVIHGHSSHHPKGVEVHRDRLILYGCGDLLNDYEGISGHERYRSELTLLYFPRLAGDGSLEALTLSPMRIRDFRLRSPEESEVGWLRDTLDRECRELGARIERAEGGRLSLAWR
jgi:poly-gamma-glutamate synthesis protein (capsule biosynthesis protein)